MEPITEYIPEIRHEPKKKRFEAKQKQFRLPDPDEFALQFYIKQMMLEYSKAVDEQDAFTLQILWREITGYSKKLNCIQRLEMETH